MEGPGPSVRISLALGLDIKLGYRGLPTFHPNACGSCVRPNQLLVRRRSRRACRHEPPGLATASLSVSRGQENSFAEVEADFFSLKQSRDAAAAADATEDSLRAGERGEKVLARSGFARERAQALAARTPIAKRPPPLWGPGQTLAQCEASLGRRLGSRCDRRREPCPAGSSAAAFLAVEAAFGSGVASRTHASLGSLGHCSSRNRGAVKASNAQSRNPEQTKQQNATNRRSILSIACAVLLRHVAPVLRAKLTASKRSRAELADGGASAMPPEMPADADTKTHATVPFEGALCRASRKPGL
ncbi:unnamed protein product [Lampetra fluviatilis]